MPNTTEDRIPITLDNKGQKIFGMLHVPKTETQGVYPVVLFCHGFGGNKVGRHRLFVRLSEHLSTSGIASLRFDFRGSGDSFGDFRDTTIESQIQDCEIAADFLSKHPLIDKDKIALLGSSLGGVISILATRSLNRVKTIALWAPVFAAQPWLEPKESDTKSDNLVVDTANRKVLFQGETLSQDFLNQFLQLPTEKELAKLSALPLLHIQGEKDLSISSWHKEQYQRIRKNAKAASEFISLPESGHDFAVRSEQEILLRKTTSWFIQHLKSAI